MFAGRVVREALRLHPAGLLGVRAAGTDVRLGDHLIRRGTLIAWSPYLAGRDLAPSAVDLPRPLGMVVNRPEGGARLRVSFPLVS